MLWVHRRAVRSFAFVGFVGVASAGFISSAVAPALAQSDEARAGARSLATEGVAAFNEGRWKDAVDLFGRAEALVHAPPHLLFLARASEKLGHLVKAREAYLKIIKETLPPNAPQAFRDAQTSANQELKAIEPRIGSLSIKVQGAEQAKDVEVLVDGVVLPSVLVGVARPVDPGEHRVEAVATGFRAAPQAVRLTDGERKSVVLTLVADPTAVPVTAPAEPAASAGSATPAPPLATAQPAPAPAPPARAEGTNGLRIGSYIAFGVGALGLGAGTLFLLDSRSKRADADAAFERCEASGDCRENDAAARRTADLDDQARSAMVLSIVGFGVGAAAVAAGAGLFLASSGDSDEKPPSAVTVRPFFGLRGAGLKGTF